jgi:hypothetical protein
MHIAAAAIALFAAAGASAWLGRRAGFWGFWVAAALLGAVLSVVTALLIPGASFVPLLWAIASGVAVLPFIVSLARSGDRSQWTMECAAILPALMIFAAVFPLLRFMYVALGSLAWPVSTLTLCLATATLLPLLAAASLRARRRVLALSALAAAGGLAVTLYLPTYSAEWPQRVNIEYWFDADTGESHYLARPDSLRLPAALAAAAHFDPMPRPRFLGSAAAAFYAAAPRLALAAPELTVTSAPMPAWQSVAAFQPAGSTTRFGLHLRSARGAPEALVVFPASAQVAQVTVATATGPLRTKLGRLRSGATLLDMVGLPAAGVEFSIDAAGPLPVEVQVFDQSYDCPQGRALQRARPPNAISSQDGDLTVVHRTVSLDPAADR